MAPLRALDTETTQDQQRRWQAPAGLTAVELPKEVGSFMGRITVVESSEQGLPPATLQEAARRDPLNPRVGAASRRQSSRVLQGIFSASALFRGLHIEGIERAD